MPGKSSCKGIVKGFLWLIILAEIAILLPLCMPPGHSYRDEHRRMEVVLNMKLLYDALERFRATHGSYPCDTTAELLSAAHPELSLAQLRGESANAYLRQLFCLDDAPQEQHFYAKLIGNNGRESTRKGDNQLMEHALEVGENAMAYVLQRGEPGQRRSVQAGDKPTPLLICAVCPAQEPCAAQELRLDNVSLRGHVFVLYTDGRVRDHEDDCEEDEEDDTRLVPLRRFFPTLPDGSDSAAQHLVLPPLLPEN